MIDLYYWTTPNGHKMTIFMEETGLEHRLIPVNIGKGEQFSDAFLAISPNNKIPAVVDHEPADRGAPISVFESGAILLYLAEKIGRLIPSDLRGRTEVLQWLFWQMGNLGPLAGQNHHFRLYAVLDNRLSDREFVAGAYSIADIACYPWVYPHERQGQKLDDYPNLARWFRAMAARPAVIRAYERAKTISTAPLMTEEAKRVLFGQDASRVRKRT